MAALIRASLRRVSSNSKEDNLEPPPKSSPLPRSVSASSRPSCFRSSVLTSPLSSSSTVVARAQTTSPPVTAPETRAAWSPVYRDPQTKSEDFLEAEIDKTIYGFRFVTILGVLGSLVGSILCFIKGCTYVANSFVEYAINHNKVVFLLVEAVDVYLLGTVMLVFGMGLYELFVSNLDIAKSRSGKRGQNTSSLFGMFTLKERPRWLEIKSVNELKTKVGHVIVMLLLIGLFEKSKKAAIHTPLDLLCFSAMVLLSSVCLYLLSKLTESK